MPSTFPRFQLEAPKELTDALATAGELYILIWPTDPPRLVITVLPHRVPRFIPTNYREIPTRLILGPPTRTEGHWRHRQAR